MIDDIIINVNIFKINHSIGKEKAIQGFFEICRFKKSQIKLIFLSPKKNSMNLFEVQSITKDINVIV